NPNYNVTKTDGTLTINVKDASVTADNKMKTYGDANPALTATVTGTVNGDTLDYTLATSAMQFSNVGPYAITVTLGTNPNYNVTKTDGTLTVDAKDASVTADNKMKTYGDANPALTATVTGTVNGDTLDYTLATVATQFSNVGPYAITVTLGANPNYNVTPSNGTLTIDKANATVTVTGYSVTYNGSQHTATGSATGVQGESLTGLDLSATGHTNAADYPSDPWTFTDSTGNYNNDSGSVHDHIDKANGHPVVTGYTVDYDG